MEVMHSSEEVIITILQVLLYDPLYSWTMSPIKAYQLQSNKTIENDPSVLDTTNMTERRTKGILIITNIVTGTLTIVINQICILHQFII